MRMSHVSSNKMLHLVCVAQRALQSPSDLIKPMYLCSLCKNGMVLHNTNFSIYSTFFL